MFCQPQCPLLGAHLQEAFSLLPVESPPLAGGPNTTTTTSEHIPWKRNGTEENEIFRDNMSDPDVVLVLKHKTLWIKLHVQVSVCKWRTHTNSILWPICLQLRHGKSVFIHLLVHHGAKKGKKKAWVLALWDIEQNQTCFWNSVISSFLILTWCDAATFIRSMCSGFPTIPGTPRGSVLLKAVFCYHLTQRSHDDCGCHRNDSSIIKMAAWDHKYSKES